MLDCFPDFSSFLFVRYQEFLQNLWWKTKQFWLYYCIIKTTKIVDIDLRVKFKIYYKYSGVSNTTDQQNTYTTYTCFLLNSVFFNQAIPVCTTSMLKKKSIICSSSPIKYTNYLWYFCCWSFLTSVKVTNTLSFD